MWESLHSCLNPVYSWCLAPIGATFRLYELHRLHFKEQVDKIKKKKNKTNIAAIDEEYKMFTRLIIFAKII